MKVATLMDPQSRQETQTGPSDASPFCWRWGPSPHNFCPWKSLAQRSDSWAATTGSNKRHREVVHGSSKTFDEDIECKYIASLRTIELQISFALICLASALPQSWPFRWFAPLRRVGTGFNDGLESESISKLDGHVHRVEHLLSSWAKTQTSISSMDFKQMEKSHLISTQIHHDVINCNWEYEFVLD